MANKSISKNKPNPMAQLQAQALGVGSAVTQMEAQRISPAITPNATQFTAQTPNVIPGAPNAAAQGVQDLYAVTKDDWFWNNWMQNAKANGMGSQDGNAFNETGVMPKLGKVYVPEQFWAYAQLKQEQAFQEDFNRFVFTQVNINTPEARAYWEKKFPGYTQQVYNAYATKMQIQAKLAEIQIKGFQNMGDLWFAFQYQNGYFERMLAPPTSRLVAISQDEPTVSATNDINDPRSTSYGALPYQMPPIP